MASNLPLTDSECWNAGAWNTQSWNDGTWNADPTYPASYVWEQYPQHLPGAAPVVAEATIIPNDDNTVDPRHLMMSPHRNLGVGQQYPSVPSSVHMPPTGAAANGIPDYRPFAPTYSGWNLIEPPVQSGGASVSNDYTAASESPVTAPIRNYHNEPNCAPIAMSEQGVRDDAGHRYVTPAHSLTPVTGSESPSADMFVIPQEPFKGKRSPVSIRIRDLRDAEILLRDIIVPGPHTWRLMERELAFPDEKRERMGKKFQIRVQFSGHKPGPSPPQHHEYTVPRTTDFVRAKPISLRDMIMHIAEEVQGYMSTLESDGTPLLLHGRQVQFEHLQLLAIHRITDASVRPILAIHKSFRHLYPVPVSTRC